MHGSIRTSLRLRASLLLLAVLLASPASAAPDAARGKELAGACTICHGVDGNAVNPITPKLAGQNEIYLLNAMQDYRSRERDYQPMNALFEQTSDQDIEDLAAWFASIPIKVGE